MASSDPSSDHERRVKIIEQELRESEGLNRDEVIQNLARRLVFRDNPPSETTVDELKELFHQIKNDPGKRGHSIREEEGFEQFKKEELEELVEQKILIQGVRLRCGYCKSGFWYPVEMIASEISCMGCRNKFPLPVSPEWSFRLNDLVVNAIKQHGTIPVLQALSNIDRFSHGFFQYLPSQDIYKKYDDPNRFTDVDVISFTEKRLIMGEVKSSPEGFDKMDFGKIVEVAKVFLPQELIFAAPGESWPAKVKDAIAGVAEELKPCGVAVRILPLNWMP